MERHDSERLRRFLAARDAGDETMARGHWNDLIRDNFDRVHFMVLAESRGRLAHDEQQEALQRALIRLADNMITTFHGTSVGEWVASTRTLVKFACIDTMRRAAAISKHEHSLSSSGRDGQDTDRRDAELFAAQEQLRHERESDEQELDDLHEGQRFLDWAVPQLSEKRRAVIELDRENVPVEEIQARLDVSRDVVYASRSRALKDLAELRGSYRP